MKRYLPGLVLLSLLAGCVSTAGRFGRVAPEPVLFPPPPDTARVQFLFAVTTESDVRGKSGGVLASFFDESSAGRMITKAYGVDFYAGRFYVCDTMLPGVDIIDMRSQEFETWMPPGEGRLRKPINCTVDPRDGRLYVTDAERSQVVVFDSAGAYVGAFGGEQGVPLDVEADGDLLWVVGNRGHGVRAYDRNSWELVTSFPEADGEIEVPLRQPVNVAVHDGLIHVSDLTDFNVKTFDMKGRYVRTLGSYGTAPGQFSRPKGVAVDRDGRLYVVDAGFQNVQVFDEEGRLLTFFGGGYDGPGKMWLPAQVRIVYHDLDLFEPYVDPRFELEFVILVTNQYGPDRLTVYGFVSPKPGPS